MKKLTKFQKFTLVFGVLFVVIITAIVLVPKILGFILPVITLVLGIYLGSRFPDAFFSKVNQVKSKVIDINSKK